MHPLHPATPGIFKGFSRPDLLRHDSIGIENRRISVTLTDNFARLFQEMILGHLAYLYIDLGLKKVYLVKGFKEYEGNLVDPRSPIPGEPSQVDYW